jgi:hypothetical protein
MTWQVRNALTSAQLDPSPRLVALPNGTIATALCAGRDHALILLATGDVLGLGSDRNGRLGGHDVGWGAPHPIGGLPRARAIACGAEHSVIVANGTASDLYVFGRNQRGQLGNLNAIEVPLPMRLRDTLPSWLPVAAHVTSIAAGHQHTLVSLADGTVCSWGSNVNGQLGPVVDASSGFILASTTLAQLSAAPCFHLTVEFGEVARANTVAAGESHSLAISSSGRLFAWGESVAASGVEALPSPHTPRRPLEEVGGPGAGVYVRTIAAGASHSLATTVAGDVWAWGNNNEGQLGSGCSPLSGAPGAGTARTPTLAQGVPPATTATWRVSHDVIPTALHTIDLYSAAAAAALADAASRAAAGASDLVSIAGPHAPCAAVCEANASLTSAGCAAFTFPNAAPSSDAAALSVANCTFYGSGPQSARTAPIATRRYTGISLHSFSLSSQRGAALVGAGRAHSLVAVGLRAAERCPASGPDGEVCGGAAHGSCVDGACVCEPGWIGDGCAAQACSPFCHPTRGTCSIDGDGEAYCACATGWTGAACTALDCPTFGGMACAGHGTCYVDATSDARMCACADGWGGPACAYPQCAAAPLNGCSNRGSCACNDTVGAGYAPACAGPQHGKVCNCADGYTGVDCSLTCPTDGGGNVCGAHGRCRAGFPSLSALAMLPTRDAAADANVLASFPPGVHCECDPGWVGPMCATPLCIGTPECGGERGTCIRTASGATCECFPGFGGGGCALLACPNDCSGNGQCSLPNVAQPPRCRCSYGYSGDDCGTNTGMVTLALSLSVAGGVLCLALCGGACLYWARASRAGALVGPADAYRQRQWVRATSGIVAGCNVAVHTPKRLPVFAANDAKGARVRIGPVA